MLRWSSRFWRAGNLAFLCGRRRERELSTQVAAQEAWGIINSGGAAKGAGEPQDLDEKKGGKSRHDKLSPRRR